MNNVKSNYERFSPWMVNAILLLGALLPLAKPGDSVLYLLALSLLLVAVCGVIWAITTKVSTAKQLKALFFPPIRNDIINLLICCIGMAICYAMNSIGIWSWLMLFVFIILSIFFTTKLPENREDE